MDSEAKKMLHNLWADDAPNNRQTPEEVGIDRKQGWNIEYEQHGTGKYPERTVWNQIMREMQGGFQEHMLYGIPRWAGDVDYPQYAFTQYDKKIWTATAENGPNQANPSERPGTGSMWRQF